MAVTVESGDPIGYLSAYNDDLNAGHCYIALQRLDNGTERAGGQGLMVEGFFVFVQYMFDHFRLNALHLEIPEYNLSLIAGGADSLLEKEGELKDYYYGDRYWSHNIFTLRRTRWEEVAPAFRGEWPDRHFVGAE